MWKLFDFDFENDIDWNMIDALFPWFLQMKEVPQDAKYHAEGNVYTHTQMVVEALLGLPEFVELAEQDKHILFAAALMHDIGKRATTLIHDGADEPEISSPGHAIVGEKLIRKMLYMQIPAPFDVRERVAKLVRYHGLPMWAIERNDPRKNVIEASLEVNTRLLYLLAKADALGRLADDRENILLKIELFKELCLENECFGKAREFKSNYGRFVYLTKPDTSPDYEPYEDLKFTVFVMAGLPGSGKDTFIKNHLDVPVLSLDEIRRKHNISPTDRKKNGVVIQLAKERAKNYLRGQKSFVHNATNITREIRNRWISIFLDYGARVKIIYLEPSYDKLITQNQNREHPVPDKAIEKMIAKMEIPTYTEAHDLDFFTVKSISS